MLKKRNATSACNRLFTFIALLLLPYPIIASEVNILVIAIHGVENSKAAWLPTINHLNKSLPQHHFSLVPVLPSNLDEIERLVQSESVDFVITQPAIYVDLEIKFGVTKMLTMVKRGGYSQFGSAIVTLQESEIHAISDLRGKRLAGVAELGFGGWLVGCREMLDHNFNPFHDADDIIFTGNQYEEVKALTEGRVDAAVLRTGMLESLASSGQIDMKQFRILEEKQHPGFNLKISTALYPEWAIAHTHRAANELSREVAMALLSIPSSSDAAINAGYQEWTFPYDYQPVHELLKSMSVGPYQGYGEIRFSEVFYRHWPGFILGTLFIVLIFTLGWIWNKKLSREVAIRRKIAHTLHKNEKKLQLAASVFSHAREGIMITAPDGTIIDTNQAFSDITGYSKEETIGNKPSLLKSGRQSDDFYSDLWQSLRKHGFWSGELWNRRKNGKVYSEQLTISSVKNSKQQVQHYIALFSDNTEKKRAELDLEESKQALELEKQKAEQMARTDPLTGLNNRRAFFEMGRDIEKMSKRYQRVYSVIMLDVDHFKNINDQFGHATGDRVLIDVARTICQVSRDTDIPARVGGEEFAIILPETSIEDALLLAERLRESFTGLKLPADPGSRSLSASFGVAESTEDEVHLNLEQVINRADAAMYKVKQTGRNQVFSYSLMQ